MKRKLGLLQYVLLMILMMGCVSKGWALTNNDVSSSLSDSLITTKIKSQLVTNSYTNPFHISVTTNNGVVSLSGSVDSVIEATTAVQIAASTKGVKDVDVGGLYFKQASQQPLTDSFITAKVKGMFVQEKLFGSEISVTNIKVVTRNGVVYLSGVVNSMREGRKAVYLATQVKGVTKVVSDLRMNPSA